MSPRYSLTQPYNLEMETKPEYLQAKVSGEEDSLEISLKYWTEILERAESDHVQKILVWEDFENTIDSKEIFDLVNELCRFEHLKGLAIAFVDEHQDQLDRNKLGEMIANNRGFNCRVFCSFSEAESWLLNEQTVA